MVRIAFLGLALALMAGCTQPSPQANASDASKPGKPAPNATFKVALLTPGPVTDKGWSQMAYDGLQGIKNELSAEVANSETKDSTITDTMRGYASKGYNLIIGHGYEYNEPGTKLAPEFPQTVFVSSSGGATAANAGAFRFYLEQGFYLAGYFAGSMTKTGTVAMVGGPNVPSIVSTFKAFRAGATAAKPDIKVLETFTGDGVDALKAKQATEKVIDQGADFVIHQANAAASGVFAACKERKVWAFGANADQNQDPSGAVIGSAVIVAEPAFVSLAKKVKEGTYKGEVSLYGMQDDAIDFVINPNQIGTVPKEVLTKILTLQQDIKAGKFVVPKDDF